VSTITLPDDSEVVPVLVIAPEKIVPVVVKLPDVSIFASASAEPPPK